MQLNHFKCSQGQTPITVCITATCTAPHILQCPTDNCGCHDKHAECAPLSIDHLKKLIQCRTEKIKKQTEDAFTPLK